MKRVRSLWTLCITYNLRSSNSFICEVTNNYVKMISERFVLRCIIVSSEFDLCSVLLKLTYVNKIFLKRLPFDPT